jgi:hypothetical protein
LRLTGTKNGRFPWLKFCRKDLLICFLLITGLTVFYGYSGMMLSRTGAFSVDGVLFEIDTRRAVTDIAQFAGNHYRTSVHPLFELLVNPPAEIIQMITRSSMLAAVLLNSLAGAVSAALAYVFFLLVHKNRLSSALLAVFFAVSSSHFFHSIIPDTSVFATLSLLVTYLLFAWTLARGKITLPLWIAAGIWTLGTTTTNFAQTFICLFIASLATRDGKGWLTIVNRLVFFTISVTGITAGLSLIQKLIYPLCNPFFMPYAYTEESDYASLLILQIPGTILTQLGRDFFLVNFFAPFPAAYALPGRPIPTVSVETSTWFSPAGVAAGVLWLAVAVLALRAIIKRLGKKSIVENHSNRWLCCGLTFCVLFNLFLHSVYGAVGVGDVHYFLFSGNFTFTVLALVTLFLDRPSRWVTALWAVLIMCALVNNLQVFLYIVNVFAGG